MMDNRLFLAVAFTDTEREALRRAAEPLRHSLRGRFADPSLCHITLRFFGPVEPAGVAAIGAAMARAAAACPGFSMASGAAGSFGRADSAVLWLGIAQGAAELRTLHAVLAKELRDEGFAPEDKPFRSHITLARDADIRGAGPLSAMVLPEVPLHASAITLFNSVRRNGRLAYEPMKVVPLPKG
jgi:2'-5' RNA ligase